MSAGRFVALRSVFANRNYAIYVSGNAVSLIGFWMQRLAVGWLTWELTESEFWVGAVAFAEMLPLLVICPLFGVWADRFNRKLLTVLCQAAMMLQSLVLFLLVFLGLINIELLFFFALLDGMLLAAHQPIRLAIIPNLVEKKDIVTASSFTAVVFNVARFVGPAIAGVIITFYGASFAILCNAITYMVILLVWAFIHVPHNENTDKKQSVFLDIRKGFEYIVRIPALRYMFILQGLVALFARPLTLMLAAFVGAVYQQGAGVLALFTSALGLGAILAGMTVALGGAARGLVRSMLINTGITLLAIILFASTDTLWFGTLLIFVIGYTLTMSTVASQTMIQNSIDDAVRGRVLSLWVSFARGIPAFGVLMIGWVADYIGLLWPTVIAAVLCFAGVFLLLGKRRIMRAYFEA